MARPRPALPASCITAEEMIGDRLVSVGRPLLNGDLRVVVPGGGPADEVPPGEVGEILVSSPSLAVGIWRDPEATAASFIIDGDRRWWRSRDLGRIDAGGYLYLEGRRDDMIISGGINIMPARVEEVLLAHRGVAECAVVGVPDPEWGERVQAFIVRADPALDANIARAVMSAPATCRPTSGRGPTRSSPNCRARRPTRCCAARCAKPRCAPQPIRTIHPFNLNRQEDK